MKADEDENGDNDEDENGDNDDSRNTYSYEYDSSVSADADYQSEGDESDSPEVMDEDKLEEELLLKIIKGGGSPSGDKPEDYKIDSRPEEARREGSDESRASWGLGAFEQSSEPELGNQDYGDDYRSSFITCLVRKSLLHAFVGFIFVSLTFT